MRPLPPGGVFVDKQNTYIRDEHADYIYCNDCGRLKMTHPFKDAHAFRMVHDSALLCTCARKPKFIPVSDKALINRILVDLSAAIGRCATIEDAQRMVWEVASKQEMREIEV